MNASLVGRQEITLPLQEVVRLDGAVTPLESLSVPGALSGQAGTNRSRAGSRQVEADTDRDALIAWLARYADSPNTLANARREVERLLLWALAERGKPISSLAHEDLLLYEQFLANPQPSDRWVMHGGRKAPRNHPAWRPFAGPLSPASRRQAMATINMLFSWLVEAGYLAGNPLSLRRQRRAPTAPRVVRFLEVDLWAEVRATVQGMPQITVREQAAYWRARWLFSLLYLGGLRISEVRENRMGSFFGRPDKHGVLRWWLSAIGKGNKERLVPATPELMVELAHYRRFLGLAPLPQHGEASPLVFPVWWKAPRCPANTTIEWPKALTRASLHLVVKGVFEQTGAALRARGPEHARRADKVEAASAHWLRHTMGSRLANKVDLRHVRITLGHASLTTTSIYLHTEDDDRHAAISEAQGLGWDSAVGV